MARMLAGAKRGFLFFVPDFSYLANQLNFLLH